MLNGIQKRRIEEIIEKEGETKNSFKVAKMTRKGLSQSKSASKGRE